MLLQSFRYDNKIVVPILALAIVASSIIFLSRASGGTTAFQDRSDVTIRQISPTTNFGQAQNLAVGQGIRSFLKFKVEGLTSGPVGAHLHLYVTEKSASPITVLWGGSGWQESTMTWNTAPNVGNNTLSGPQVIKFTAPNAGTWVDVPVPAVFVDGYVSYALTNDSGNTVKFASRDTDFAPQLVLNTADTVAPEVSLAQPGEGANLKGIYRFQAQANDNTGAPLVVSFFRQEGTTARFIGFGTKSDSGYSFDWNTASVPDGSYGLTARAKDEAGNVTATQPVNVKIKNSSGFEIQGLPSATFTASSTSGTAPVNVNFLNTSTNVSSWLWDFGDGTTSTALSPTHVYASPGDYNVTLSGSSPTGNNQSTAQVHVDAFNRPGRAAGPTRVLLFGDSITNQYSSVAVGQLGQLGYDVTVIGDNAVGLLTANPDEVAKLRSYANQLDPDKVVLENVGNYDIANSILPELVPDSPEWDIAWRDRANGSTLISLAHGAQVWWIDNPAMSSVSPFGSRAPRLTQIYHNTQTQFPSVRFVDAYTPFGGANPDQSLRTGDGVHLSVAGMQLMTNLVQSAIQP